MTTNISNWIINMGFNISAISRKTGISDNVLRRSIVKKERSLRADETMKICEFLGKDPFDFYVHSDNIPPGA